MTIRTALVALLLAIVPLSAQAQSCFKYDNRLLSSMLTRHGEVPMIRGETSRGPAFEIFVNPATKTWTLFRVFPNGVACMVDSGEGLTADAALIGRGA